MTPLSTPVPAAVPVSPSPIASASRRWPIALLALTLAACGGGGGDSGSASPVASPTPAPPPPAPAPAPTSGAPTITTQPADVGLIAPAAATFVVAVTGSPAPTIQWQKSASAGSPFVNIAGATSATLTLTTTSTADNGSQYQAVTTNSAGVTTSRAATLTVTAAAVAPVITSQPGTATVTAPASATFTVAATGSPTVSYQWQTSTDGGVTFVNIPGATSPTYNTPATTVAGSGQQFRVVVSNGQTTVNSQAVVLTVVSGAVGSASACTGAASYATGFSYNVVYDSPASNGTFTTTTAGLVNGPGTFHGQAATEIEERTTIAAPGGLTVLNSDTKTYTGFNTSTAQLTLYGSTSSITDLSTNTTAVDSFFNPPSTDARFTLNVGGTTTISTHQTVTRNGAAQPSTDETTVVTFGGVETLTVPAGTFQSCKFSATTSNGVTTTTWLLYGTGVLLKSSNNSGVSQARTILVNGVRPS